MVKPVDLQRATKGLPHSYQKRLQDLPPKHIFIICNYIWAVGNEIKFSDTYRQNILNTLMGFSKCFKNKPKGFKDFTRSDIIKYLDQFKKEESLDPTHKWIGTYNAHLVNIIRFFRWLYYPDLEPKKRPKPKVIQNLSKFTRREISDYKPADMWGPEHNLIFLKYCQSPRDRCYHAMEMDTGARPHELLKSRIKDIEFKEEAGIKYAEIIVNGKTGQRVIPLIDSLPYVIQWISLHPQGTNREAFLLPSETKAGGAIKVNAMTKAYEKYKKYFKSLLSSKNVIEEEKKRIRELLQKRWNTYTYRHSCLTEKSNILSDNQLRQFAGWTARSQMHHKYVHLSGGEATKNILKARGIIKEGKQSVDILQPKVCPNCRESNRPDAQFCHKCSFVMSFEVYTNSIEERKKKDQEILDMREQMNKMSDLLEKLNSAVELYKPAFISGMQQANPHLDPSGFEISPFNDQMTDFLRRRGMKETSTTQG